jgi:alkylation response protein AidB-like acyl-CoA dehydrogenase
MTTNDNRLDKMAENVVISLAIKTTKSKKRISPMVSADYGDSPDISLGLFRAGLEGELVERFQARVQAVVDDEIVPAAPEAEASQIFPRTALTALAGAGILTERWNGGPHGDLGMAIILSETIGQAGYPGISGGISQHVEGATSMLKRFARNSYLHRLLDGCLQGTLVACIAASEPTGGSDLNGVRTSLVPTGPGRWQLRGRKKFVSLSPIADFALVLARLEGGSWRTIGSATMPSLALVAVERPAMKVGEVFARAGVRSLATAPVDFDTEVREDAIVGPLGAGLMVLTHGLTHERLSIAAGVVGCSALAIGLTATHLARRHQFGRPLIDHQALRMRLAELAAIHAMMRTAVRGTALTGTVSGRPDVRTAAGLKATVARLGEHIISECMHMFGGPGYLEDESPMARLWRDCRIARIAAGTDEMMWEIVAGGIKSNDPIYDSMVNIS